MHANSPTRPLARACVWPGALLALAATLGCGPVEQQVFDAGDAGAEVRDDAGSVGDAGADAAEEVDGLRIREVSPTRLPFRTGGTLTLTGDDFRPPIEVRVGGAAASIVSATTTQIRVEVAPPERSGPALIELTSADRTVRFDGFAFAGVDAATLLFVADPAWDTQAGATARLAVADLNSDGRDDLAAAIGPTLRTWVASPVGFTPAATIPADDVDRPFCIANDGGVARVVRAGGDGAPHQLWASALAAEPGEPATLESAGATPDRVVCIDLDGDGIDEVVLAQLVDGETSLDVLALRGGQLVASPIGPPATRAANPTYTFADLDGDGAPDLVLAAPEWGVRILRNDSSGRFADLGVGAVPAVTVRPPISVVPLRLDGDDVLDLLILHRDGNVALRGRGDGTWEDISRLVVPSLPLATAAWATDIDADGTDDLVTLSATGPGLYRNDGTGRLYDYTDGSFVRNHSPATSLALGDVDGDGDTDLVLGGTQITVLRNWAPLPADDEDLDGWPDLVDNCRTVANNDQRNSDRAAFGCTSDADCRARHGCGLAHLDANAYLLCTGAAVPHTDARAACSRLGATLLSIESDAENRFVASLTDSRIWLDLTDEVNEGTFVRADGTSPGFFAWSESEPNDSGGTEDCGEVYTTGDTGRWNDVTCSQTLAYICEAPATSAGDPYGDACDVCPFVSDPSQLDTNGDGIGDACAETP